MPEMKGGVIVRDPQIPTLFAWQISDRVHEHLFGGPAVMTSGEDGTHGKGSHHTHDPDHPTDKDEEGWAMDLRTRHLATHQIKTYARELKVALGRHFDVVIEPTHIHVEFDPDY